MTWPTTCAEVTYDHANAADYDRRDWEDGDLVWDPKMGEGHVIAGTRECGPDWYCGYCGQMCDTPSGGCGSWVRCECGGFDPGDHHGYTLRKCLASGEQSSPPDT